MKKTVLFVEIYSFSNVWVHRALSWIPSSGFIVTWWIQQNKQIKTTKWTETCNYLWYQMMKMYQCINYSKEQRELSCQGCKQVILTEMWRFYYGFMSVIHQQDTLIEEKSREILDKYEINDMGKNKMPQMRKVCR